MLSSSLPMIIHFLQKLKIFVKQHKIHPKNRKQIFPEPLIDNSIDKILAACLYF